jgi:hypothetical protein
MHLYTPVPALRSTSGATMTYTFASAPQRARLEVLDSTGTVLRTFTHDTTPPGAARPAAGGGGRRGGGATFIPKAAGINRFTWDLRTEPIVGFPGMILWGAGLNGPVVPPGTYTLRLTADGQTVTAPLTVRRNPLVPEFTDADLHAQYQFTRRVRDKATEANLAVIAIRNVKAQIEQRLAAKNDGGLRTAGRKLIADASAIEEKIYQVRNQSGQDPLNFPIKVNNRLANLLSMAERGDGPPGTYMPEIFEILSTELKGYTDALDTLWKNDLAAFNQRLSRLGLAPIDAKCAKAEGCGLAM